MQKTVKKAQKGFTLIELLIVIAVIAILAAIAIPNLLASRKAANESSAVSSLRTIVSAQETYRSRKTPPVYGDATALGATGAKLIDEALEAASAAPGKSGYLITITTADPFATYTVNADPVSASTGDRHFFVDESGVIRVNDTAAASATDPPIQ